MLKQTVSDNTEPANTTPSIKQIISNIIKTEIRNSSIAQAGTDHSVIVLQLVRLLRPRSLIGQMIKP